MKETDSERRRVREENDRNSTRAKESGEGEEEEEEEGGVTEHCFSRAGRTKAPLCAVLRE